jgi:hypothetical protein
VEKLEEIGTYFFSQNRLGISLAEDLPLTIFATPEEDEDDLHDFQEPDSAGSSQTPSRSQSPFERGEILLEDEELASGSDIDPLSDS